MEGKILRVHLARSTALARASARHNRLLERFALFCGIHHLVIPGLRLLKLIFRSGIAKVALQQSLEQLRQALSVTIGINHKAVVSIGGKTYATTDAWLLN